MSEKKSTIVWTKIDEAPALATYAFLPVVKAFTKGTGIEVETRDISLAGRIIATFPERLRDDQRINDELAYLGELVKKPEANIIKLPNISASVPQLKAAIAELQAQGYDLPDYPEEPKTDEEKEIQARYATCLGSAVNPVLREGNSDRRAAESVKKFAQKNPHKLMKPFPADSKAHVAHMNAGDFYGNEKSVTVEKGCDFRIELVGKDGQTTLLKDGLTSLDGEILSGTFMSKKALRAFYAEQIADAKKSGILLSLHLKATMMKVSDPILFGHCVSIYYEQALKKHADTLKEIGFNPNLGIGDLYKRLEKLPEDKAAEIKADIEAVYDVQPELAMVDSSKGITNLHVPNDVIIDASMPVVIRDGGRMWGRDDQLHDTKAMIPDRCYATFYQTMIEDCQKNGQFDPATMGSVSNVGLMAQKAEEYGSHPTTFEIPFDGTVRVVDAAGNVLMEHEVEAGDIWRMSRAKDIPIQDWVKLAVNRAKASGQPAIFWLDKNRAHDAQLIAKVEKYLKDHDTTGLDIRIMAPVEAMKFSCEKVRKGESVISVTGNVLRDYLTDLFPILELGTSARMLSIVPLLNGGGLFETGAGGSAPKHVQQFLKENHLRWDSLGEYCALVPSLEMIAANDGNTKAAVLAETLDQAIGDYLENQKLPSRKAKEIDNRGSSFWLSLYWARRLAAQDKDADLKQRFTPVAQQLEDNAAQIDQELIACQGEPVDIGGYYHPDTAKTEAAMRPSATYNAIIDALLAD
ncbi:MAG: NADP-dependent isocitrate dehydrogenase [Deltaproteobacteria bacterium]|nr:MAG: NADP-dependent isocitrate dehydrogenase [Deltaproteobacteria bacterium]